LLEDVARPGLAKAELLTGLDDRRLWTASPSSTVQTARSPAARPSVSQRADLPPGDLNSAMVEEFTFGTGLPVTLSITFSAAGPWT